MRGLQSHEDASRRAETAGDHTRTASYRQRLPVVHVREVCPSKRLPQGLQAELHLRPGTLAQGGQCSRRRSSANRLPRPRPPGTHCPLGFRICWPWRGRLSQALPCSCRADPRQPLGPFDLLSRYGLSAQPGVTLHNTLAQDQIDAIQPWTALSWMQVHSGHLPLWNPFGGLGTPLAFNLQSAPFGVPALVGYAFPLQYAATVGIIVTVIIAGTGAYAFGRLIRLTPWRPPLARRS